ncbi:porin [Aurantimonas sp. A2-1-M11]|uniref:porin n=1 Tax=Aurantimonas sp. A2-1-M11 TaxID=3113712 RepID=UPI002F922F34
MNIKSLLLGSAAAIVAVSGARAADVIMPVAPEPVDYVRVCDVYGTGFYYIPGTETCLSINGYVRFQYNVAGGIEDDFGNDYLENFEGDNYQAGSAVRVRLHIDAREETELGTLRAFARLQANNSFGAYGADADYRMDQGYLQLGGLTMGYTDSLWTDGDGLLTDTDLAVGDLQTNRVSYTYAADGFTAALSLEDDGTGDFAPDVIGRLAYAGGWGSIYLAGSYDENQFGGLLEDDLLDYGYLNTTTTDGDGAFALKAGLSLKDLVAADSQLKIEGSYAFDPSTYSTIGLFSNARTLGTQLDLLTGTVPVEWQVGAGYAQTFGKLGVAVSGVYGETFDTYDYDFIGGTLDSRGNGEYYKLVGNVGYEITNNFDMLAEISYANIDYDDQINDGFDNSIDQTAGFLRFVRYF